MDLKEFAMLSNHKQDVGLLWIEKDAKDQVVLKVTPRDIRMIRTPFIRGSLVTSGTLAENRSCQSFAKRMKFELDTDLVLNSPFPLNEQTIVYVGKDISPKKTDYEDQLEKEILGLLGAGKQKTFILFTSNKLMWTMFKRLHTKLREIDNNASTAAIESLILTGETKKRATLPRKVTETLHKTTRNYSPWAIPDGEGGFEDFSDLTCNEHWYVSFDKNKTTVRRTE